MSLWLIFILCWTPKLWAYTVLVQGPQTSALDYQAALQAHPEVTSPSEEYLKAHPLLTSREKLLNEFSDAQKAFLEQSIDEARKRFVRVAELLLLDDWAKGDREIFLQVFLRLAQLESEGEARDHWLFESLALGEDLSYDSTLYPPPVLSRRKDLAKTSARHEILRAELTPEWSVVLINGVRCGPVTCGLWPSRVGRVRVTLVSDQWVTQSAVSEISKLTKYRPNAVAWAEGTCGTPQWNSQSQHFANKKVFWGLDCNPMSLVSWAPKPAAESAPAIPTAALPPVQTSAASTPFYQSKWFWIGIGTAAAVAVVLSTQKHETREPTTSYGY